MARKRSRIEQLKMPFVVTVALGATAACGGTVTRGDGEDRGTPDTGGSGGGGGRGGLGGHGDVPQASDGGAPPVGAGGSFVDQGNGGSGNPPFPPPVTFDCPLEKPAPGNSCNHQGPSCDYDLCGGVPTTMALCENFSWTVLTGSCNPPPPPDRICPGTVPTAGGYCNYQGDACGYHLFPGGRCSYLDTLAWCETNRWIVKSALCTIEDAGAPVDSGTASVDGG